MTEDYKKNAKSLKLLVFIKEKQHGEICSPKEAALFWVLYMTSTIVNRILYGNYPITVHHSCSSLLLHYCKYEQTTI